MSYSKQWDKQERLKVAGKVTRRIELLLARGYIWGYLKKPLEELSDDELRSVPQLGVISLAEIRMVIPRPNRPIAVS